MFILRTLGIVVSLSWGAFLFGDEPTDGADANQQIPQPVSRDQTSASRSRWTPALPAPAARPMGWRAFTGLPESDDLRSPLWAPPVPRRQPTARGRWVWLPDPSEIRGNGLFTPDAITTACEIGPCAEIKDAERQGADGNHCRCQSQCRCTLCVDDEDCTDDSCPFADADRLHPDAPESRPCDCPATGREVAEIAELMSRRPSVLAGSMFQAEEAAGVGRGRPACEDCRRQDALRTLRQIEAEVQRLGPTDWADDPQSLDPQPTTEQRVADSIRALRETSFDLEVAAQRLEEQQLYYRADQLRETAIQLRQEARSALGGWSLKRLQPQAQEAPVGAERDLGLELEQLREELLRVREALRPTTDTTRR